MAQEPNQERRAFLAIALAMGVLLLWNVLFPIRPAPRTAAPPTGRDSLAVAGESAGTPAVRSDSSTGAAAPQTPGGAPSVPSDAGTQFLAAADSAAPVERVVVHVENANLGIEIDGVGARITKASLPEYEEKDGHPVQLVPAGGPGALGSAFVVGGQRVGLDGQTFRLVEDTGSFQGGTRRVTWELARPEFTLRKTYTIPEKGNLIGVEHELVGDPGALNAWGLSWAGGMRATEALKGQRPNNYFQGVVRAEGKVQRKPAAALSKGPADFPGNTYFVGVQNKYFLATIVPREANQGPARLWLVELNEQEHKDVAVAGEILVERMPGVAANRVGYDVYVGPLDFAKLAETGLGIEGAVDLGYSWVRPLSEVILKVLIAVHKVIPNYGIVIILFSATITLLFFPLTFKSAKSMRDMAALKPRLDALKEKYEKEPQKLSEATMKLYKEAGVNPFGGCFPLLLQMPIFFALYAVLFHTIELRGAPFFGWISDLSQPDVIFHLPFSLPLLGSGIAVLPIVMGITSYFQSKQMTMDPSQKMMTVMMPVVMTFVFFSFPSGLVLYWLTNNVLMIAQKAMMKPSTLAQVTGS